eukprot:CAMPEP_0168425304 /NCGR_PEP_ID=MMETSP0228-20121227/35257_1 /TAXON_ID=133427 /ORGANISM="Protoceratium reticulatum, Strain CCCM 535 (=CCMP 1889)" /LENGTH=62 /DNA_ID=CAMNT_0008439297 /DNA_START=153 /DNA_END=338 /DNA_ORIENTATION=-
MQLLEQPRRHQGKAARLVIGGAHELQRRTQAAAPRSDCTRTCVLPPRARMRPRTQPGSDDGD